MIDHNITNVFLVPAHNYTNKINILAKYSSLLFHSGSVANILWSDDSQNWKIRVRTIDIVMEFNSFTQKDCELDCVIPNNSCTNEAIIHGIFHCNRSLLWSSIRQIWIRMAIILLFKLHYQI